MKTLVIRAIAFPSFLKLAVAFSLTCGVVCGSAYGLWLDVWSFFGSDHTEYTVTLFSVHLKGTAARLVGIPLVPILLALMGVMVSLAGALIGSLVGFFPFQWLLRARGGMSVMGDWGESRQTAPSTPDSPGENSPPLQSGGDLTDDPTSG